MSRALSFSRRTLLSFSTGIAGAQDRDFDQTTYHLIGSAHLSREFGRTWVAAYYNRGVRNVEPLGDPLFSDSVMFAVSGVLQRAAAVPDQFRQIRWTPRVGRYH